MWISLKSRWSVYDVGIKFAMKQNVGYTSVTEYVPIRLLFYIRLYIANLKKYRIVKMSFYEKCQDR